MAVASHWPVLNIHMATEGFKKPPPHCAELGLRRTELLDTLHAHFLTHAQIMLTQHHPLKPWPVQCSLSICRDTRLFSKVHVPMNALSGHSKHKIYRMTQYEAKYARNTKNIKAGQNFWPALYQHNLHFIHMCMQWPQAPERLLGSVFPQLITFWQEPHFFITTCRNPAFSLYDLTMGSNPYCSMLVSHTDVYSSPSAFATYMMPKYGK